MGGWVVNPILLVSLLKKGIFGHKNRHKHGEHHSKIETEVRVMRSHAKEPTGCQQTPRREPCAGSLTASEGTDPAHTLILALQPPEL